LTLGECKSTVVIEKFDLHQTPLRQALLVCGHCGMSQLFRCGKI